MPDIRIRLASAKDIGRIQAIAKETWHSTYDASIPEDIQDHLLGVWYSTEGLRDSFQQENSRFLVAEIGNEVVGFAQFTFRPDGEAQLGRIYVLPKYHGQGLGGLLLENGLEWLRQKKVERLLVIVSEDNKIARGFYESKGFKWLRDFDDELRDEVIGVYRVPSCEYELKVKLE